MLRAGGRVGRTLARCAAIVGALAVGALWQPIAAAARGTGPGAATDAAATTSAAAADPFLSSLGRSVFRKAWVSAPASTDSSDGLGPLYNARACSVCHPGDGRARPSAIDSAGKTSAALVMRLSIPPASETEKQALAALRLASLGDPTYGLQLQTGSIQGHAAEGLLAVAYRPIRVPFTDGSAVGLAQPDYRMDRLGYGHMHPQVKTSPRLAPRLVGLGWLAAVPEAAILAWEDANDRDGDGISGRASRVWSPTDERLEVGRFGLKAAVGSLRQQIADAFAIDMGLSSPAAARPAGDCTARQIACRAAPAGTSARHGGHEVGDTLLDLVTAFVASLDPPPRRHADHPEVRAGERHFRDVGCSACHRPSLLTSPSASALGALIPAIEPFTDLLLHDMGEGLADHRPEGTATGREWRTAPLWGIGHGDATQAPPHHVYLHDGRASTLEEAILWHGGEAEAARDAFVALPRASREQLIAFLRSL